jgi:hypothetical protein
MLVRRKLVGMQLFCEFKAAAEFAVYAFNAIVLAWDRYFVS